MMRERLAPYLLVGFAFLATLAAVSLTRDVPSVLAHGFFVIDATTKLFAPLINLVFLGITLYIWTRVHHDASLRHGIARYSAVAAVFLVCCNLAIFAGHLLGYWMLLEATTLAAVPLIQHGGDARALWASWRYFLFSAVGLGLALLGIACLVHSTETTAAASMPLSFETLANAAREPDDVTRRLGLGLLVFGLGTKLGLAPLYGWLPETYDAAPPATTAMLAAVQFNVALVGLLRVLGALRDSEPSLVSGVLIVLGLLTMVVSALNIIVTRNYKKLIAYASLNHAGVIAIGLGVGARAAYGVVLYVISNALIKAILFLTAGKIRSHYETEDLREVSGVISDMPFTGVFFMVGTFALLGLPPFGSFVGELLILSGLMRAGFVTVFVLFCVVLAVTFIATGRSMLPMIWGETKKPQRWGTQPLAPLIPKLVFLAALVALGLYVPAPLNALLGDVARASGGIK